MNHKAVRKELQSNFDYRVARAVCGADVEKRYIVTMDARITCAGCMEFVIAELDFKVTALREIHSNLLKRDVHSEFIKMARHSRPSLDKN